MTLLKPSPVSTDSLMYIVADKLFVSEISNFGKGFNFERVYDDACDVGMTLVSARTGDAVVFAVTGEQRDADGDLMYWTLEPAPYQRNRPTCTVHIYND